MHGKAHVWPCMSTQTFLQKVIITAAHFAGKEMLKEEIQQPPKMHWRE